MAETLDVISSQGKTQNGVEDKENNMNEPPSDIKASDITVEGDVKLLRRANDKYVSPSDKLRMCFTSTIRVLLLP